VPIATAAKIEALKVDFGSQRRLAEMLGVSPAQVSRWLRGQGIDPLNADKIDVLELVMASLLRIYDPEVARQWLLGVNPHLGNRRPIDLVRMGRVEDLLGAIYAERAESYA
jgi:hypothetical protein